MITINSTLVIQIINFLILIWILNRVFFKPIFKIVEERESKIEGVRAEAVHLKEDAANKARQLDEHLKQARHEASERKDEVRGLAAADAGKIIDEAKAQAQSHIEEISNQAGKEADEVRASVAEFKDALVRMVFLKVMGRNAA